MTIGVTQLRPESRGTIHAVSSDPLRPHAGLAVEGAVGGVGVARMHEEVLHVGARQLGPGAA
jgi:hypothetical protein